MRKIDAECHKAPPLCVLDATWMLGQSDLRCSPLRP